MSQYAVLACFIVCGVKALSSLFFSDVVEGRQFFATGWHKFIQTQVNKEGTFPLPEGLVAETSLS